MKMSSSAISLIKVKKKKKSTQKDWFRVDYSHFERQLSKSIISMWIIYDKSLNHTHCFGTFSNSRNNAMI